MDSSIEEREEKIDGEPHEKPYFMAPVSGQRFDTIDMA
jgi:hypothetical protein